LWLVCSFTGAGERRLNSYSAPSGSSQQLELRGELDSQADTSRRLSLERDARLLKVSSASASLEAIPSGSHGNRIAFKVTRSRSFSCAKGPQPLRKASFEVPDVKARGVNLALQTFLETFLRCPDPRRSRPRSARGESAPNLKASLVVVDNRIKAHSSSARASERKAALFRIN
jgi:hypothetical protein